MSIAYISPFRNETNDYIELVKSIVRDCGQEVRPLSFKTLASAHIWGLFDHRNTILVHWLETRPFSHGPRGARLSLPGLLQFLIYFVVLLCARARLVYFVHDHAVHDLTGWRRALSAYMVRCLCWLAKVRVVHDPSFGGQYRAHYLPHPLYKQALALSDARREARTPPFKAGILGAIRPYKRIEHIVPSWPKGWQLLVRGRAEPAYEAQLRRVILASANGAQVTLQTGFMSREAFDQALRELDALVLAHADASALVSGAFFEAIGNVPFIIARKSPFTSWAQQQFRSVLTFETDAELVRCLNKAAGMLQDADFDTQQSARLALTLFGHEACVREYGIVLGLHK